MRRTLASLAAIALLCCASADGTKRAALDDLEHRTFNWFWETTNPQNGLVPDRWPPRMVKMWPSAQHLRIVRHGDVHSDGVLHEEVPMESAFQALLTHLEWAAG